MDSYGDGYGYGDQLGYGYGDGAGDGYGDGYGYGCGSGCVAIGTVDEYSVEVMLPWRYVRIGCECHNIDCWRESWRAISKRNKVSLFESEVEELLCKALSCVAEQTEDASSLASANPSR